jgi:hypothetical protein
MAVIVYRGGAVPGRVLGLICAGALVLGCGEDPKPAPEPRDIDAIGASVADIVVQCGSVRRGFVEEPDRDTLRRDVEYLRDALDRLDPDARFRVAAAGEATTLREQARLAVRQLERGCAPDQATALGDAAPE